MPRMVDAQQRRALVFDAVFEVIAQDGIHAATLRAVADRAGLAIGSVRHYFDSHESLMVEAVEEMTARVSLRIQQRRDAMGDGADRVEVAAGMLAELLPLTRQTRQEAAVWLEFVTAARTRPALRANAEHLRAGTAQLAHKVLAAWGWSGTALSVQATHLAALVDGLVVQLLLQPGRRQQAIATDALTEHLRALHQRS